MSKAAFSISQAKVSKFILKNGPAELTRGRISPFSAAAHASLSPLCLARRIVAPISNSGCSAGWLSLGTTLQPCRGPCDFSPTPAGNREGSGACMTRMVGLMLMICSSTSSVGTNLTDELGMLGSTIECQEDENHEPCQCSPGRSRHHLFRGQCCLSWSGASRQVTLFVLMLGLFVPDDLPHATAMHLNMLRRCTVLLLLSHWHTYECGYVW